MKRAILAIVVLVALGTAAVWACNEDPQGKMAFYHLDPYCIGGGHGCIECSVADQSGDYQTCVSSNGTTICTGRVGGTPYTL